MTVAIQGLVQLETDIRNIVGLIPGGQIAESLEDGAWVIALEARDNVIARDLVQSYALHDSIGVKKINQSRVDIEVRAIYGAAHEFGLEEQEITPRQRAFFWAMWASEGDLMWKYLALSETYTIKPKPYLRPAVDSAKRAAAKIAARTLEEKIKRAIRG